MSQSPDRLQCEEAERLYRSAGRFAERGAFDDARRDYIAVIALVPEHFGALNDLGGLLYRTDFRTAARSCYAEAIRHHPDNPVGRINLANALLADGQAADARGHYEIALGLAPEHPDALQGMANLLQDLGETEAAEAYRRRSYATRRIVVRPYRGGGRACRILELVSAVGGNVPTRFLFDPDQVEVSVLVVESNVAAGPLPPHDLVFNAVGDPDLSAEAIDAAERVVTRTRAPIINPPSSVRATGRVQIAQRLSGLPGVITPRVVQVTRQSLTAVAGTFERPFLMRAPGFHTGRNFVRVDPGDDVEALAGPLPGEGILLIQHLDARGADGHSRKYRAMMIGGQLFPLHLAVSPGWKVHYFTADMADRPDHRAEEAAFLTNMAGVLGSRAMAGLEAIAARLSLDYAGVDFGLSADGEVLLFEANATMVVNPPDADPRWDYRRGPVRAILAAASAMLLARAGRD